PQRRSHFSASARRRGHEPFMFSDAELFGSRVSMVEFQGGAAGPIAAVLAFASPESDEPLFPLSPPLPEISHPRVRASPLTECIGVVARTGRLLGRLCSPNGEHSRQNFRRYRDRITPLMRSLEGNTSAGHAGLHLDWT